MLLGFLSTTFKWRNTWKISSFIVTKYTLGVIINVSLLVIVFFSYNNYSPLLLYSGKGRDSYMGLISVSVFNKITITTFVLIIKLKLIPVFIVTKTCPFLVTTEL